MNQGGERTFLIWGPSQADAFLVAFSCGLRAFRMPKLLIILYVQILLYVFLFFRQRMNVSQLEGSFCLYFFNLKTCFQLTLQHSVKARQTYLSFSLKQSKHLFFFFWWSVALTEYHVGFCPHDIHFQSLETVSREQMRHMDSSYGINMYYGKFPPTQRTSRSALENKCLQCRKQALLLPLKQALPREPFYLSAASNCTALKALLCVISRNLICRNLQAQNLFCLNLLRWASTLRRNHSFAHQRTCHLCNRHLPKPKTVCLQAVANR